MKRLYIWMAALGVTGLLGTFLALSLAHKYRAESPAQKRKLLILGIDGMDPELLQRFMDGGKMPNFTALAARGSFLPLETSIPPQSPVAWANLITGMNPASHGIFDFIHRYPA